MQIQIYVHTHGTITFKQIIVENTVQARTHWHAAWNQYHFTKVGEFH